MFSDRVQNICVVPWLCPMNVIFCTPVRENEFEKCGLVVLRHLFKRVVPEECLMLILVRVQHSVIPTVPIAARVVHPDVIAKVGKLEGQGIGAIKDPSGTRVKEPMLKDHHGPLWPPVRDVFTVFTSLRP